MTIQSNDEVGVHLPVPGVSWQNISVFEMIPRLSPSRARQQPSLPAGSWGEERLKHLLLMG